MSLKIFNTDSYSWEGNFASLHSTTMTEDLEQITYTKPKAMVDNWKLEFQRRIKD